MLYEVITNIDWMQGLSGFEYKSGSQVTLTAVPGPDSRFTGWDYPGCPTLDPVCVVTIDGASQPIMAYFEYDMYNLDVFTMPT